MTKLANIYITNFSIEGILTSIFEAYDSSDEVYDILPEAPIQMSFDMEYKTIKTDMDKAKRVRDTLINKISESVFQNIMITWLSELPKSGINILNYIRLGLKVGDVIEDMLTHPVVMFINNASRKVNFEQHRFLGLCRFSLMQGNYYQCVISPDHNILPLIAPHFAARFGDQRLLIIDEKRNQTLIYDGNGNYFIAPEVVSKVIPYHAQEKYIREMWKRYFDTLAIKERINPKLQRQMMPRRYWKNIVEMKA